jgi:hypothetical protein
MCGRGGAGIGRSKGPAGELTHAEHGGFSPLSRRLVYHRLRLPHARQQVLGLDLNCSESRIAEMMLLSRYAQGDWECGYIAFRDVLRNEEKR